jgi:hypothetical protein
MSKLQSKLKNLPPQPVLKPCDVEFCKTFKNVEEGVKVKLSVSEIEVHIAATTVHTVMGELADILEISIDFFLCCLTSIIRDTYIHTTHAFSPKG